jgi:hypothetical protein
MPQNMVTSLSLGTTIEAGPAWDAPVSMQHHRREFSYQVTIAGPPAP